MITAKTILTSLKDKPSVDCDDVAAAMEFTKTMTKINPKFATGATHFCVYTEMNLVTYIARSNRRTDEAREDDYWLHVMMVFDNVTSAPSARSAPMPTFKTAMYRIDTDLLKEYIDASEESSDDRFISKKFRFTLPYSEMDWVSRQDRTNLIYKSGIDDLGKKFIFIGTDEEKIYAAYLLKYRKE